MKVFNLICKTAACAALGLTLAACSSTPTQYPTTNPNNVHLLPIGTTPACQNYATLGSVSVPSTNEMGEQRTQSQMNNSLRFQAAGMGATAVMNIQMNGSKLTGTAIHCNSMN